MSFGDAAQEILGRQSTVKYDASRERVCTASSTGRGCDGDPLSAAGELPPPPPLHLGRGTWDGRCGRRQSLHVRATTSTPAPLRDATARRPGPAAAAARDGGVAGHHGALWQAGAHLAAGPRPAAAALVPAGAAGARVRGPRAPHQPGAAADARQGLPAALRLQAQATAQAAVPLVLDGVRQTPRLHHGLLRGAVGDGNLTDAALSASWFLTSLESQHQRHHIREFITIGSRSHYAQVSRSIQGAH